MRAVVFNYLVGNNDAHGKNFAILYDSNDTARLAPFYDILCAQAYDQLTDEMCMKVGEHYNFIDIVESDWQALCKATGFSFQALKKIMTTLTNRILGALEEEKDSLRKTEFDHPILEKLAMQVQNNCKTLSEIK